MAKRTRAKRNSNTLPLAILLGTFSGASVSAQETPAVDTKTETPASETPAPGSEQTREVPTGEVVPQNQSPTPPPTGPSEPTPGTGTAPVKKETNAPAKAPSETIVVTGSRIKRIDAENATPTKILRQEDFNKAGVTSVVELLQNQSENSFGSFMGGGNYTAVGQSTFSLRGLGADRTLILINGRRLPREASLGGTNINNIPLAMVDRIEILKSSAAAVYGADAIAGVVNVILKKSVNGSEVSVKHNQSYEPGGNSTKIDAVTGFNVLNTDVTLAIGGGHSQQILTKNRKKLWQEQNPYDLSTGTVPGSYSWGLLNTARPTQSTGNYIYRANANCPADKVIALPNNPTVFLCRDRSKQYSSSELMPAKDERFGTINLENQFGDVSVSTTFMATETSTKSMPSSRTMTSNTITNVPYTLRYADTPADLKAQAQALDLNYADDQLIKISAPLYFPEFKGSTNTTDTSIGALLALQGPISSEWDWHVDGSHFITKRAATYEKAADRLAFVQNVFPMDVNTPSSFNVFTDDPSFMGQYFNDLHTEEQNYITSATAYASGPVFELPGGKANIAAGATVQHEKFVLHPDARDKDVLSNYPETSEFNTARYLGSFFATGEGKRDVKSLFAELNLPFIKEFEIGLTARWDDYSDFGDTFNYGTTFMGTPAPWMKLRGNIGSGFRAPSLSEIFNSADGGYLTVPDEKYCQGETPADNPCGINVFNYSTFVNSPGNKELQEETSLAWTLGFVLEPSEMYNVSVDYWNTSVDDVVSQASLSEIIEKEIAGDASAIARVQRRADGRIVRIDNTYENLGELRSNGYDIASHLKLRAAELDYGLNTSYSRILSRKERPLKGAPMEEYIGSFGVPRYRMSNSIFVQNQVHSASFDVTTRGRMESGKFSTDADYGYISPEHRYDFTYGWKYMDGGSLSLGVYNIENRLLGLYVADRTTRGVSYSRSTADLRGRQLTFGLKQAF